MIKDVRIQLAIGGAAFIVALIDSLIVQAKTLSDLSIIGKTGTAIMSVVLAWFVVRYLIIGLIFRK